MHLRFFPYCLSRCIPQLPSIPFLTQDKFCYCSTSSNFPASGVRKPEKSPFPRQFCHFLSLSFVNFETVSPAAVFYTFSTASLSSCYGSNRTHCLFQECLPSSVIPTIASACFGNQLISFPRCLIVEQAITMKSTKATEFMFKRNSNLV